MLNNKNILITGGTGSFGQAFVKYLLSKYPKIKKLIIFSRDELKQHEMASKFSPNKYKNIRFFLGDVRDKNRLDIALKGIDYVVHAAALKQVPAGEYNPFEFIKTNILGAQNLVESCINNNVKKLVGLSTDKATSPINLYGATKLCSEKLFVAGQNMFGKQSKLRISIVRYGNVFASRGSVVTVFLEQKKNGLLTLTDKKMTRFNLFLQDGINTVMWALKNSQGGEIIVPKALSLRVNDLANIIGKNCKIKIIGKRPGEKLHEELISAPESYSTIDLGKYMLILPEQNIREYIKFYKKNFKLKSLKHNKSYNSNDNKFITTGELKKIINKYLLEKK